MPRQDMPRGRIARQATRLSQVASAKPPILALRKHLGDKGDSGGVDVDDIVEVDLIDAVLHTQASLNLVCLDHALDRVDGGNTGINSTEREVGDIPNVFDQLPIELMWEIGLQIESDKDLCNFQSSCRHANTTTKDGKFWRRRFKLEFDSPRVGSFIQNNAHFEDQYKKRRDVLRNKPFFLQGTSRREMQCLAVLKDLILDSFSDRDGTSKNIQDYVLGFLHDGNLLEDIFGAKYVRRATSDKEVAQVKANPLMRMLQVLLAPVLLDPRPFGPDNEPPVADFPRSQFMAYSSVRQQPVFVGCSGVDVNFTWVLHQLNFWRCHMLSANEATLNFCYTLLEDHERPQFWSTALQHVDVDYIGKKWKGAYGFVNETDVLTIRTLDAAHEHIQDEFSGDEVQGEFQDLTLDLTEAGEESWSPIFEDILRSLAKPQLKVRTRAQKASALPQENLKSRSFRFGGRGEDQEERFLADGWFNSLPPQMGVSGWQRMTMMKYFTDDETNEIDYEALWAYEGVVLPGGQIIIGRWWSPTNIIDGDPYSGPFILWCVDSKQDVGK
ncbi:hypothetical protein CERZMDRAFT_98307 [Cercospora zeae-maydis SCOH1-5]|uniref:F-box domain-containing protein n=1 Tax=Cercospora zeae-maydis SCOH1-5 TaxID=717836 RepID=A0A6A6FDG3_9PEZI|nr:hypothetical protein CERZMDRAFT_98307 [Cercospora zeae-maydis SCOH1-5]